MRRLLWSVSADCLQAVARAARNHTLTQLFQRTGTPQYMAPEALAGKPYGRSADVWALGCILYELLTLKRAFDATNLGTMYTKIMEGAYKPVSEQFSPDVRELLASTLRKEPHERPSVAQLLEAPHVRKHLQLYARFACARERQWSVSWFAACTGG